MQFSAHAKATEKQSDFYLGKNFYAIVLNKSMLIYDKKTILLH